jgi:hypothetical protein
MTTWSLDAELLGTVAHMQGGRLTAVSADTTINRKDWGLTWNVGLESGGWLVGDEIKIHIELVAPGFVIGPARPVRRDQSTGAVARIRCELNRPKRRITAERCGTRR